MKRLHRKRKRPATQPDRRTAQRAIAAGFEELVALMRVRYGHLFETYWLYEGEVCPCCGKRPVGVWHDQAGAGVSLNTFIYSERRVLIGYQTCRVCGVDLLQASEKWKAVLHEQIEACLIAAYDQWLEVSSERG